MPTAACMCTPLSAERGMQKCHSPAARDALQHTLPDRAVELLPTAQCRQCQRVLCSLTSRRASQNQLLDSDEHQQVQGARWQTRPTCRLHAQPQHMSRQRNTQCLHKQPNKAREGALADEADELVALARVGRAHHDAEQARALKDVAVRGAARHPRALRQHALVQPRVHALAGPAAAEVGAATEEVRHLHAHRGKYV